MITNMVVVDFLTVTTFESLYYTEAVTRARSELDTCEQLGDVVRLAEGKKRMQYVGKLWSVAGRGSVYHGIGIQQKQEHYMMVISGELASQLFVTLQDMIAAEELKCTRIDLQMTVDEPANHDQQLLYDRVREVTRNHSIITSAGETGTLSTVYHGRRSDRRYSRIYEKEINGERFLRAEVEIKSELAAAVAAKIARGSIGISSVYKYEIEKLRIGDFAECFLGNIRDHEAKRVKIVREDSTMKKREKWIRQQVMPALFEYSRNPLADSSLLAEIAEFCIGGFAPGE